MFVFICCVLFSNDEECFADDQLQNFSLVKISWNSYDDWELCVERDLSLLTFVTTSSQDLQGDERREVV